MSEYTRRRFEEKKVPEKRIPELHERIRKAFLTEEESKRLIKEYEKERDRTRKEFAGKLERQVFLVTQLFSRLADEEDSSSRQYSEYATHWALFPTVQKVLNELASDEKEHARKLRRLKDEVEKYKRELLTKLTIG